MAMETTTTTTTTTTETTTTTLAVKGIGVLVGLPRVHCGAVVAHEIGHAYLHLNLIGPLVGNSKAKKDGSKRGGGGGERERDAPNTKPLSPATTEGLCELFAFLFLQSLLEASGGAEGGGGGQGDGTGGGSDADSASARLHSERMRENKDKVYGNGFRAALAAFENMVDQKGNATRSLPELLRHVKRTGALPRGRWKPQKK